MSLKLNERYPGRFNNPSPDYPGGSFKNRTTPVAKDGSYLEQDWANDKEGFFQSIIAAAGATPNGTVDKVGASQFFDCLLQLAQNQVAQAFPTAGTATALTLTPTPAISAYAANQRFSVKFHVDSGVNPTINASAKGAKSLKQYDSAGAKVAAKFAANQVGDIVYDGADFVLLTSILQRQQSFRGLARNWKALATGLSASIVCTADNVIVANAVGDTIALSNFSQTLNTAVTASATVNGMAPSVALAINTWYAVYVWYNSTTGVSRVTGDTSFTSPTAPASGFDMWAYRGSFRTDSSAANKFPLSYTQDDWNYQWKVAAGSNVPVMIQMAAGAAGNPSDPPTWANVGVGPFVSPVAKTLKGNLSVYNNGFGIVAPNNAYGGINQTTSAGAPFVAAIGESTRFAVSQTFSLKLESANIYYAASGTAPRLFVIGWSE